jgi:hypothetical protein
VGEILFPVQVLLEQNKVRVVRRGKAVPVDREAGLLE